MRSKYIVAGNRTIVGCVLCLLFSAKQPERWFEEAPLQPSSHLQNWVFRAECKRVNY